MKVLVRFFMIAFLAVTATSSLTVQAKDTPPQKKTVKKKVASLSAKKTAAKKAKSADTYALLNE